MLPYNSQESDEITLNKNFDKEAEEESQNDFEKENIIENGMKENITQE
jgi:hypothetical protein